MASIVKIKANVNLSVIADSVSHNVANNTSTYQLKVRLRHTFDYNATTSPFQYSGDSSDAYRIRWVISAPGYTYDSGFIDYKYLIGDIYPFNHSVTVYHNSDGTPPSKNIVVTLYGGSGSSFAETYGHSVDTTVALPTIPRASSFTLSGATQTNASINVTIDRKSTAFTHKVRLRIGSGSWMDIASGIATTTSFTVQPGNMPNLKSTTITVGVQTYNGETAIGSEATATRVITIPNSTITLGGTAHTDSVQTVDISNSGGSLTHTKSWKLGSATGGDVLTWTPPHSALPSATSGTLTCTVVTKNGTATINTVSATRTITVPDSIKPTFTAITHAEYVSDVATKVGAYVQGKTRLTLGVTSPSAGEGSSIKSYSISVAGHTVSNGGTTPVINQSGTLTITATVTDNRNRAVTKTTPITVLAYENPIVTGVSFTRSNEDGTPNTTGTHLTIKATIRVRSLVVKSVEKNKIWYQSESEPAQAGYVYTTKTDLKEQAGTISGNYRQSVYTHTFSGYTVDYPYNVRVRGGDIFSWTGYIAGGIPTGVVLQHWGEDTTAFGKMIDDVNYNVLVASKGMKVDGPTNLTGGVESLFNENLDTAFTSGLYYYSPNTQGRPTYYGVVQNIVGIGATYNNSSNWLFQLAFDINGGIYHREKINTGVFSSWSRLWTESNSHAIVDSGSNSNGRYIKFSDGTLIITMTTTANLAWSKAVTATVILPLSVINANYQVQLSYGYDLPDAIRGKTTLSARNKTTSSFQIVMQTQDAFFDATNAAAVRIDCVIYARWK